MKGQLAGNNAETMNPVAEEKLKELTDNNPKQIYVLSKLTAQIFDTFVLSSIFEKKLIMHNGKQIIPQYHAEEAEIKISKDKNKNVILRIHRTGIVKDLILENGQVVQLKEYKNIPNSSFDIDYTFLIKPNGEIETLENKDHTNNVEFNLNIPKSVLK